MPLPFQRRGGAQLRPTFSRDFAGLKTLDHGVGPAITFTRASNATYFDVNGVLQTASNDQPRFDHDPATGASRGLLIEESRTNSIRNSQAGGSTNGVIGSGGVMPTNWFVGSASGITREVVGTGTANGLSYVDLKLSGTNSSGSVLPFTIGPEGLTQMVATSGQTWTSSIYVALAAGATTGIATLKLDVAEYQAPSTYLANSLGPDISLSATMSRFSQTRTLTNASTDRVATTLYIQVAIGATIDLTLRIAAPQLEQGAFPTSYIPTTTAAATRSADSAVVTPISSFYNQSEGTLFAEAGFANAPIVGADRFPGFIAFNDETPSNFLGIIPRVVVASSSRSITAHVRVANVVQMDGAPVAINENQQYKSALAVKLNDVGFAVSGSAQDTDTSATLPTVTQMIVGQGRAWALLNGHIRKIAYYPRRLSNTLLQQLTT